MNKQQGRRKVRQPSNFGSVGPGYSISTFLPTFSFLALRARRVHTPLSQVAVMASCLTSAGNVTAREKLPLAQLPAARLVTSGGAHCRPPAAKTTTGRTFLRPLRRGRV